MTKLEFIKELRVRSGLGLKECNEIYAASGGDWDKAKDIATARGIQIAAGKENRDTKTVRVFSYLHPVPHAARIGVLLELACETDFAANTPFFPELAHDICLQIASMWRNTGVFYGEHSVDEFLSQEFIRNPAVTVKQLVAAVSARIGENIRIIRFTRVETGQACCEIGGATA